jgi:hypothetical protein
MHRQSDSIRCEWASATSSSKDVTTAFTVANSSCASCSGVGTPQATTFWACSFLDEEAMPGLRRQRREGALSPSPGMRTQEPLDESPCSIAKVAKRKEQRARTEEEERCQGRCNILGFRATKNMSFLKIFLQLCEACSIYVEPKSNSLTRRCIHVELVAGVCSCS